MYLDHLHSHSLFLLSPDTPNKAPLPDLCLFLCCVTYSLSPVGAICWNADWPWWLDLGAGLVQVPAAAVSSCVHSHPEETFPSTPPHPPALTISPHHSILLSCGCGGSVTWLRWPIEDWAVGCHLSSALGMTVNLCVTDGYWGEELLRPKLGATLIYVYKQVSGRILTIWLFWEQP